VLNLDLHIYVIANGMSTASVASHILGNVTVATHQYSF